MIKKYKYLHIEIKMCKGGAMKKVLDLVNDYIIILDPSGEIKFCNKSALKKLEYTLDELINIDIDEISYYKNKKLKEYIREVDKQENLKISFDLCSKSGKKVSLFMEVIVDSFEGREYIIIVAKDICEKIYKREDLEKILDNLDINCWLKNMKGEYVYVNKSYAEEMKDDRLNILGKTAKDYWSKDEYDSFTAMDREVIESKKIQITENYNQNDDSESWVEIYKAPILDESNEVEFIIGYTKEITLQKKLENEMYLGHKEINNLNNILMNSNLNNCIKGLITNIGKNIINYFDCDGVSAFLINKENSCLDLILNIGKVNKFNPCKEILEIDLERINDLSNVKYLNSIFNVNDINNEVLKKHMIKNEIENIGIYTMKFSDEIIGFLVLKFLENDTLRFNKFDYLKTISGSIATIIKSHTLSKEVKKEFEKRKQIESELELLLEISVDLIAKISENGEIKHINSNWSKTLGWTQEELLSMNILDIIHTEHKDEYRKIMNDLESDTGCIVIKMICKDNTYKWIEFNYKALRNENKFIITAKDITEQRKQEHERKALQEAIQIESLKNEFFANISHEFRTPLNIILGTMQLMQRNVDKNKITWDDNLNLEAHINYIKQNSYRLLRLVNNLIDITCIDSGYYKLQLGNYNIVDIVENITLSVAQYIKDHDVDLIFDTNCEEKIIACDPDKIERIVLNLLSNAIKYTDKYGCIYVDLEVDDEKVKVSVKDNGIGMSSDKLDVIFDRFKKIDNSLNRKCEGSGIGLSLVKSLVELQEGHVYVNSEVGVGSEFTFELPNRIINEITSDTLNREISKITQIEKCNIEFSDIYS